MYLVLDAFADILFALYHVAILYNSLFTCVNSSGRLGPDFSAEVSSAKRKVLREVQLEKSLINMRKRVGPSKLP
jgi:hypothetical protein